MNIEKLTQKSQEALREAQTLAVRRNHQGVDVEHLLTALLAQQDGVASVLLERAGVPVADLKERVERELGRVPQVAGPGSGGAPYVTQRLAKMLAQAEA
jgi:ATP-dependent Clp protease ATP-binding subunit ClpB